VFCAVAAIAHCARQNRLGRRSSTTLGGYGIARPFTLPRPRHGTRIAPHIYERIKKMKTRTNVKAGAKK